jgi:alkylation response protein AidB-like acyl-CoA dehydrogenase
MSVATEIRLNQPAKRASAHRIISDSEAIQTAEELRKSFAANAAYRDQERVLPRAEIDSFSCSGLWAITVPRAYGGAEVSAATLAEVVALISEGDASIGQIPQNHYFMGRSCALERDGRSEALLFRKSVERRPLR